MPARTVCNPASNGHAGAGKATVAPDGAGLYRALLTRLPHRVRGSLDHEQREALRVAAEELRWGRHPVDIRVRLPLPGLPVYLAVFAGFERRQFWRTRFSRLFHCRSPGGIAAIGALLLSTLLAAWWWYASILH